MGKSVLEQLREAYNNSSSSFTSIGRIVAGAFCALAWGELREVGYGCLLNVFLIIGIIYFLMELIIALILMCNSYMNFVRCKNGKIGASDVDASTKRASIMAFCMMFVRMVFLMAMAVLLGVYFGGGN